MSLLGIVIISTGDGSVSETLFGFWKRREGREREEFVGI